VNFKTIKSSLMSAVLGSSLLFVTGIVSTARVSALHTKNEIESFMREFRLPKKHAESHTAPFKQLLRYFFLSNADYYLTEHHEKLIAAQTEYYEKLLDLRKRGIDRRLEIAIQYKKRIEPVCNTLGVGCSDLEKANQNINTYNAGLTLLKGLSCLLKATTGREFMTFLGEEELIDEFFTACTYENVEYFNPATLN